MSEQRVSATLRIGSGIAMVAAVAISIAVAVAPSQTSMSSVKTPSISDDKPSSEHEASWVSGDGTPCGHPTIAFA
jgi:hypothetical protein